MRIGIIGAGTGGAATALFAARAGHTVTVLERVADPRPVGAGILIQPTGQHVLSRLGLVDEIRSLGAHIDALRCVTARKRTVLALSYGDAGPDIFGIGLHRGTLFESLFRACRSQSGIELRLGVIAKHLELSSNERFVVDDGGERHGPFDLVVVASGANHELTDDHQVYRRVREYEWGAMWGVVQDPEGIFTRALHQIVDSSDAMMGFLPSGRAPGIEAPTTSVFWSVHRDRLDSVRNRFDAWKKQVLAYEPRSEFALEQLQSPDQLGFARYRDATMRPWHGQRVVYIGDAAHAMSPQLGQGANLALYDAMILADSLRDHSDTQRALELYSASRRSHLGFYQWVTRLMTPFFQSDSRTLALLRDYGMPLACKLPYLRKRMVQSMCGVERGVFARILNVGESTKTV